MGLCPYSYSQSTASTKLQLCPQTYTHEVLNKPRAVQYFPFEILMGKSLNLALLQSAFVPRACATDLKLLALSPQPQYMYVISTRRHLSTFLPVNPKIGLPIIDKTSVGHLLLITKRYKKQGNTSQKIETFSLHLSLL